MKTKMRSRLRCVPLEDRVVPASGGSDPFQFMLGSFAARGGGVNPYDIDVPPAADGSITFPGATRNGQSKTDAAVRRLNADGSSMTFGNDGVVVVPFFSDPALNTTDDYFSAAQVLPDGSVIASGVAGPESVNSIRSFMTVRLSPTGQLDPTFGDNGRSIISPVGSTFVPVDLVVLPNGSTAILGSQSGQIAVALLDSNGALTPTFGQNGYYHSSVDNAPSQIDVQPLTNRLVISSGVTGYPHYRNQMGVLAITPTGQTDLSFGKQGVAAPNTSLKTSVRNMFIRSDGVITLIGSGYSDPTDYRSDQIAASQFTVDGQPDNDFGVNGSVSTPLPAENITQTTFPPAFQIGVLRGTANSFLIYSHAIPTPQDFYVESGFNSVTRIQSFGQVDLSFGNNGTAPVDFVPNVASHSEPFAIEFAPHAQDFQISGPNGGSGELLTQDENGILSSAGVSPFFPVFEGPIRTVTADVNGDGVPDLIGGSGPGGGPHVIVIDGKTKFRMAEFFAFEQSFFGGINVTAGDLNGDGKAEIVVTPDRGGGPIVAVFDGAKLASGFNNDAQLTRFFGIEDKNFRGGARAAIGDVSGDGTADLLVSAGFEGGPRIALFDGTGIAPGTTPPPKLRPDFFAFEPSLRNGAYVTLGDLNGDGQAELVFGGGPGGAPRVRAFDGKALLAAPPFSSLDDIPDAQLANFFAADADRRGGIRLAIKDVNGSPALLAASGENEAAQLRVFPAATLLGSANPQPSQVLDLFNGAVLADGVFVG